MTIGAPIRRLARIFLHLPHWTPAKWLAALIVMVLLAETQHGIVSIRPAIAAGNTYYVSVADGNDSYDGLEQTHTTGSTGPWKTIAKVNGLACGSGIGQLNAGDSVLFKNGETWREQLTVPCSGTSGNVITYGSYGGVIQPIISAADLVSGFSDGGSNIWDKTGITTQPNVVIINGDLGTVAGSRAAVNSTGKWFWTGNTLSVYATSDPSATVEVGQRNGVIDTNSNSYLTFTNLTIEGANAAGINTNLYSGIFANAGANISIVGVTSQFNNNQDLLAIGVDRLSVSGSTFGSTGGDGVIAGDGICLGWPGETVVTNITISGNTFNGTYGRQAIGVISADGLLVTGNTFTSSFSASATGVLIDLEPETGQTVSDVIISANAMTNNTAAKTAITLMTGITGTIASTLVDGNAIIADYCFVADGLNGNISGTFTHNSCIPKTAGSSYAISFLNFIPSDAVTADYNVVRNYTVGVSVSGGSAGTINVFNSVISECGLAGLYQATAVPMAFKNNIVSFTGVSGSVYMILYTGSVTANYNLYYHPNDASVYWSDGSTFFATTIADWRSNSGQDANGKDADPKFTTPGSDFTLQSGSPAIDAGTDVGLTTDIVGNTVPMGSAPDIGAYEYLEAANAHAELSASVAEILTISVAAVASGNCTADDGASVSAADSTATTIALGTMSPNAFRIACQDIGISSNAGGGYALSTQEATVLKTPSGSTIPDTTCDAGTCSESAAAGWTNAFKNGFGHTCKNQTGHDCASAYGDGSNFRQFANMSADETPQPMMASSTIATASGRIKYRLSVGSTQAAGTYQTTISYIVTAVF